jgi:L-alanine-DL-glutamate epimerase-like enolase superfamily enzyme
LGGRRGSRLPALRVTALRVPERPGFGVDLNDKVVRAHLM